MMYVFPLKSESVKCFAFSYKELCQALRETCPYWVLFWSAFSRIRTKYGEIQVSLGILSECGKIQTRVTPDTNTFHAVRFLDFLDFLKSIAGPVM